MRPFLTFVYIQFCCFHVVVVINLSISLESRVLLGRMKNNSVGQDGRMAGRNGALSMYLCDFLMRDSWFLYVCLYVSSWFLRPVG